MFHVFTTFLLNMFLRWRSASLAYQTCKFLNISPSYIWNHKVMSWDLLLICRLSSLTMRSMLCQSRQAITFNVYSLYLNCSIHKVMSMQPITVRSKWSSMCYVHTIEVENFFKFILEYHIFAFLLQPWWFLIYRP